MTRDTKMLGNDLNLDELKHKIGIIRAKTEFVKEFDCVRIKFLDPRLASDETLRNLLDPAKIAAVNSVMPFYESVPDMALERFDRGMRIKTSDPDAVLAFINQLLDPDFILNLVKQAKDKLARNDDLSNQIGRISGGTSGPGWPDDFEKPAKEDGKGKARRQQKRR